jgi:histidyl-tRNA synthetase
MSGIIQLPKGTQDYYGQSYEKLEYLKSIITNLYKKYHGEFIETPVFELTHILMDKYGDDEKLIYNLESDNINTEIKLPGDMQSEQLSLRYDHTVPLVRFCIQNKINKMRRCCIGKAYRKESVTRTQVRLREFYQADFDYVGTYDLMVPEIEIFCMIQELFKTININNYQIQYNYRQNLDYYVKESGITAKFSSICSSIDKLDKKDKDEVRIELKEKGCTDDQINTLYKFLFSNKQIMSPDITETDNMFNQYIDMIGILDKSKIIFNPVLARGSDYYTGIIFEVKLVGSDITSSVSAGGRYDKLIPSYQKSKNPDEIFPMIGFSFGIDRILPLITSIPSKKIKNIWISTIGKVPEPLKLKLNLIGKLINKGYGVFYNLSDRKFKKEISDADEAGCNYMIIIGEDEWNKNMITIKDMCKRTQEMICIDQINEYFAQTS